MILFTICDLFTMNIYDGNGIKTPKYIQTKNEEKIPRLVGEREGCGLALTMFT